MFMRFILGLASLWGCFMGFIVGIAFGTVTSFSFIFLQTSWMFSEDLYTIIKHHVRIIVDQQHHQLQRRRDQNHLKS